MDNALQNHDCPPKMSDGRHFTDYRPSDYVHDLILQQNGINNSHDLKSLLTNQGLELQKINRDYYETKNSCQSCGGYYLPDPNGHVNYWEKYNQKIGYQSLMTLGCPVKPPKPIPTVMPPLVECRNDLRQTNHTLSIPRIPPSQIHRPEVRIMTHDQTPEETEVSDQSIQKLPPRIIHTTPKYPYGGLDYNTTASHIRSNRYQKQQKNIDQL